VRAYSAALGLIAARLPGKNVVIIVADAMTPDAASFQPRKRSWKRLIVALACVVAVVTIVLLATPPKPEPVKVWFVRATNVLGEKKLVFEGTNGSPREIVAFAVVVTGSAGSAKAPAGPVPSYDVSRAEAAVRTSFTLALATPPKDVPYRVMWWFDDIHYPQTREGRFRKACCYFFVNHGMPALARRFARKPDVHYIPSSEIKE